jgi:hypothetical protein
MGYLHHEEEIVDSECVSDALRAIKVILISYYLSDDQNIIIKEVVDNLEWYQRMIKEMELERLSFSASSLI